MAGSFKDIRLLWNVSKVSAYRGPRLLPMFTAWLGGVARFVSTATSEEETSKLSMDELNSHSLQGVYKYPLNKDEPRVGLISVTKMDASRGFQLL